MTEYELATLADRGLSHWIAVAQVAATVAIGIGQIAIVWFGLRVMQRMGERRAREQDQRHEEAMTALRALIAGHGAHSRQGL